MRTSTKILLLLMLHCLYFGLLFSATAVSAQLAPELVQSETEVDIVGDKDGISPAVRKALQDTIWIADWTFDTATSCDDSGWEHVDNRILNDGQVHWHIESGFTTGTGMAGNSAAVGYHADPCCVRPDGYRNDWYQAIRVEYNGAATLSFDYIVDSEFFFDLLRVETDSSCASFDLVDLNVNPGGRPASFRDLVDSADGLITNGEFNDLSLTDYGTSGTHCVYIAFFSDGILSPCDGRQSTSVGEAIVVDNIVMVDNSGTRSEDFEDGTLDIGQFLNIADSEPFGTWARLYRHISDNDLCTQNTTCAWLWTDHTTPTLFNDPSLGFGPGGFVVRNWLDDVIISPWVSLASTATATGTVIQFRRFGGNFFATSQIVHNWSVRGSKLVDGTTCVSEWTPSTWFTLDVFSWVTFTRDLSTTVTSFDPTSERIQVRHRVSDWQWIRGAPPPSVFSPGPGPYIDRTRIGRRVLTGPAISADARFQAQDCFPTELHPGIPPGAGEHFRPTLDRFGTCAFSNGRDVCPRILCPNLITGDSIWVKVKDQRGAGGVTAIDWYGAIVRGPHVGKAPAPWAVGPHGFFVVPPDSVRQSSPGNPISPGFFFVDLDDTYFRGGDVLQYFWLATDASGGVSSDPFGLSAPPGSVAEAEEATGGLLEVSFLPSINWDSTYVARIAADAHGDLEPTAAEITNSSQKTCILYAQFLNSRRRSGDANRTSFMYTLDRLGYRDAYDVYDHTGFGDTNNHLGGRATIEQAVGYSLIVYDAGNQPPTGLLMPDGSGAESKVDQVTWFRNWLAQASTSEPGFATLWIIGSNALQEKPQSPLYSTDMGVVLNATDQGLSLNPNVAGAASFTFDRGLDQATQDFTTDFFTLNGGCPSIRNYDALGSNGTAVITHRYRSPTTGALGDGAIVMNRNETEAWNTIFQSHPWFDILDPTGAPASPSPEQVLLDKILAAALPVACLREPDPVDAGEGDTLGVAPRTALYQNVPNPFNPVTRIQFDVAAPGHVSLRIYDVAGRIVRTLMDEKISGGRDQSVVWNGQDENGRSVSSGIYLYRLQTSDSQLARKMVLLR